MTHEQKINYFRMAAGLVGYNFHPQEFDLLVSLYDVILEKGGDTDLDSISKVELEVQKRHEVKLPDGWDLVDVLKK